MDLANHNLHEDQMTQIWSIRLKLEQLFHWKTLFPLEKH